MKKFTLFAASLLLAFAAASCSNDDNEGGNSTFEATITLSESLPSSLVYGEPVSFKASVETQKTLTSCVMTGVKGAEGAYTPAGDPQTFQLDGNSLDLLFFPDSKEITAIEVTLYAGSLSCTNYYPVSGVTGESKGTVWMNETAALYADQKVATHDNDPETYPDEGTGAGSDTQSFFSMHGVSINGEVKHILSLSELRSVDGLNGSMCFLNVLQNTKNNAYIGGQRGYMFSSLLASQLGGGTTGRQCDLYEVNGHGIKDANIDNFQFYRIAGSWIGDKYNAELYTYIDKLFISIDSKASTTADKMRAFWQLGAIQRDLDNSTLGVTDNPTSLTLQNYLRRWTNAGQKATAALEENFRAGDYIICRSKRGTEENPVYYYGLMQIKQIYDDKDTFVDGRIDQTLAEDLFGKPVYLNIKVQCEETK